MSGSGGVKLSRYYKRVIEEMTPELGESEEIVHCGPVKVRMPSQPLGRSRGTAIVSDERVHVIIGQGQIIQPREQIATIEYEEGLFEGYLKLTLRGYTKPVEYFEGKRQIRRLRDALGGVTP